MSREEKERRAAVYSMAADILAKLVPMLMHAECVVAEAHNVWEVEAGFRSNPRQMVDAIFQARSHIQSDLVCYQKEASKRRLELGFLGGEK